ncbi:ornithine decarboxylase antizyme-domain-containing protein [Boeremia exigua]|uniref:ornithine decarboxylase antizyme-domain-containing protein n=1 Tax=Boeremia exigua TaxID=749465 RepID=UPI001E8CE242|nr:ornithine decarboxylase antizyme-domain-containing protein [Boeremia exigua]KAH6644446.1 ornithine decarboxylase antizyme-domain-containing protein [Boeremia exigua]
MLQKIWRTDCLQGIPSPPSSPPLAASNTLQSKARRGGAAYTITVECERLFCETLRSVFLGEGNQRQQDSLVTGMFNNATTTDYGTPGSVQEVAVGSGNKSSVTDCLEMWDYVGGIRFRGFVAEQHDEKAMFVFFDQAVMQSSGDLKAGLMALLELCEVQQFGCDRLVVAIDRSADSKALMKDLGWIGFGLATLEDFVADEDMEAEITSQQWLFMEMET